MPDVAYCDAVDVMIAIRDRLRIKLSNVMTPKTCFICADPVPSIQPAGEVTLTIFNAGDRYDDGTYMGAGPNALDDELTIMLTLIIRSGSDTPPKSEDALIHDQKGMLKHRRLILRALLVSDDQDCEGYRDQWVMLVNDMQVLRERGPIPRGWSAPQYERIESSLYLSSSLTLTMNFDQDLNA